MSKDIHSFFQLAAKFFYKQYRQQGGSPEQLARILDISPTYLSAVINGSRSASLDLQCQIAETLHGPYDRFIAIGRQLRDGQDPFSERPAAKENAEKLIARLTHLVMDYKEIAKKLEISEKKFRDISLTTGDMIFELDSRLAFQFVAGKVEGVTGRTVREVLGKPIHELLFKDDWERIQPYFTRAMTEKKILDHVVTARRGEHTVHLHCIAKPIYSEEDGKFMGFRGTCRDITKRKKLENGLREQMWLFRSSLDAIKGSGVIITDRNNTILQWNQTVEELFGFPRELLEKRDLEELFSFLEDKVSNVGNFRGCINEFMSCQEELVHFFTLTSGIRIRRRVIPLYRDGVFAGRVFFLKDVTAEQDSGQRPPSVPVRKSE